LLVYTGHQGLSFLFLFLVKQYFERKSFFYQVLVSNPILYGSAFRGF